MDPGRLVSMLCFSAVTDELASVLDAAACSFMDERGRFHLARPVVASGQRRDIGEFCGAVLARVGVGSSATRIDLGAGREPVEPGVLANPIKLLHWIITQAAAVDFHPTVNAYIFSSDPDDILPFLPFHPAPGRGGVGTADVVAVRLFISKGKATVGAPASVEIDGYYLTLPDRFD
jgi:hypothetical protein